MWRAFRLKCIGIGFQQNVAGLRLDLIFVEGVPMNAREKQLPKPCTGVQPHGVNPAVPCIEIADDADASRVGRPDYKARSRHAIWFLRMGSHCLITTQISSLGVEMQVQIADCGGKTVWIRDCRRAAAEVDLQPIVEPVGTGHDAGKKASLVQLLQLSCAFVIGLTQNRDTIGAWEKRANNQTISQLVHSEDGKRIRLVARSQRRCPAPSVEIDMHRHGHFRLQELKFNSMQKIYRSPCCGD